MAAVLVFLFQCSGHFCMHRIRQSEKDSSNCIGWKRPLRPPSASSCSKQDLLEQVAQGHIQSSLEYLQGWRSHRLSESLALVFGHPHSENIS